LAALKANRAVRYAPRMSDIRAVKGLVSGRVQGVAYRASFRREALARGVTGWVRNRSDGSVEFLVQGQTDHVQQVLDWAKKGPTLARVADVAVRDVACDLNLGGFEIRY
jgi:acylphosphatase